MTDITSTIVLDLDGTLTIDDKNVEYPNKKVQDKIKQAAHNAQKSGYKIHINTARNMRTYKGDIDQIHKHTKPIAVAWLKEHGISYDDITFGKPWGGERGGYVDDKNISLEEFIFKFTGPFSQSKIDIVIPFYNEELNINTVHHAQEKLDRLFDINKFIYVENGSTDQTRKHLHLLAQQDHRIQIVDIDKNQGYGHGLWAGITQSNSDYIMTNHADNQFDAYAYVLTHMHEMLKQSSIDCVIPTRLNRDKKAAFRTAVLHKIIAFICRTKVIDFNGQPKIIKNNLIKDLENPPKDFCIDLCLFLHVLPHDIKTWPIIQQDRNAGVSSWAGDIKKTINIALRYLNYARTWKKR